MQARFTWLASLSLALRPRLASLTPVRARVQNSTRLQVAATGRNPLFGHTLCHARLATVRRRAPTTMMVAMSR